MQKTALMLSMMAFATYSHATIKPCEELKEEIAARIDANGVPGYRLKVVPIDADEDGKQVGTCDGGTIKIMYVRG